MTMTALIIGIIGVFAIAVTIPYAIESNNIFLVLIPTAIIYPFGFLINVILAQHSSQKVKQE